MAPTRPTTRPKTKSPGKSKKPSLIDTESIQLEEGDGKPGCIYLGHIPHGFHEEEMSQYFSQFGHVLGVKLCRSKKNGNSKGYGFVKFRYAAVAKTVAETCNNYLFFNKLLKCDYKPISEVHKLTFRKYSWTPKTRYKKLYNNRKPDEYLREKLKQSVSKSERMLAKLAQEAGMEVKLDDVMDVPSTERNILKEIPKKEKKMVRTKRPADSADTVTGETEGEVEPEAKKRKVTATGSFTDSHQEGKENTVVSTPETPAKSAKRKAAVASPKTPVETTVASIPKSAKRKAAVASPKTPVETTVASTPKSAKRKAAVASPKTPAKTAVVSTPKSEKKKAAVASPKTPAKTAVVSTPKSAKKKVGVASPKTPAATAAVPTPKSEKKKAAIASPKTPAKNAVVPTPTPKSAKKKVGVASPKTPAKTPVISTPKSGKKKVKTPVKSPKRLASPK